MGLIGNPVVRDVTDDKDAPLLDEAALAAFGCDVAFVSDESIPADALVAGAAERADEPQTRHLLWAGYDRLNSLYQSGSMISHPARLLAVLRQAAAASDIEPATHLLQPLLPLFDRVNRVLFQHQTLGWLLHCDLKVRVYGSGWEQHPTFAELARGAVESAEMRRAIWRASRINLATGPYGAARDDVLAGIGAGAFYVMRFCPADLIERFYPPIAEFCRTHGVQSTIELRSMAPRGIRKLVGFASRTLGMDILGDWDDFVPHVLHVTSSGRARSAAAIWGNYPAVCFHTRDELLALCTRYLYDGPQRLRLADEMRRELADAERRVTVSVDRDLLSRLSPSTKDGAEAAA